jgi:MFS family permease
VIFFFASAAASAAYLTVSEIFPLEMRAVSISLFYAFGIALGGGLMCIAGFVAWKIGIDAERRPLEEVCAPLGMDARKE